MRRKDLVKKADRLFSKYIRDKYAINGAASCITCGKVDAVSNMDAGHFIDRRWLGTRWHEKNVYPQCRHCNRFLDGNIDKFKEKLLYLHGEGILEELEEEKKKDVDINAAIEYIINCAGVSGRSTRKW